MGITFIFVRHSVLSDYVNKRAGNSKYFVPVMVKQLD